MAQLNEDAEWIGEWGLPGTPHKIPGRLSFARGQIRLNLLDAPSCAMAGQVGAVHGRTNEGPATLTGVRFNGPSLKDGIAYSAVFDGQYGYTGKIFGASIGFDLLREWAVPDRLDADLLATSDSVGILQAMKDATETFESQLDDDVKCTLVIAPSISHHHIEGAKLQYKSRFIIESQRGVTMRDMVANYIHAIQYFLMAVMGRTLNLSDLEVRLSDGKFQKAYLPVDWRGTYGSDLDHFFNVEPEEGSFGRILRNWCALYRTGPRYLRRFFQTLDTLYVDSMHFPSYLTVLEMCYIASHPGSTTRNKQREVVEWALGRFKGDFDNIEEFTEKVTSVRNALAHYKDDRMDDNELAMLTHDLFYLTRVILVEHCGARVRHRDGQFQLLRKKPSSERFSGSALFDKEVGA